MRLSRLNLLAPSAALLLAVTACSGDDDPGAGPTPSGTAGGEVVSGCDAIEAGAPIPPECFPSRPTATATPSPPAEGSAGYDALEFPPVPGQLMAVANNEDASLTKAEFTVTVKAGNAFGVLAVCEGLSRLTITTVPDSDPAVSFACGSDGTPSQLSAEGDLEQQDTTYQVMVEVPAPARWAASFYQTDEPVPAETIPGQ